MRIENLGVQEMSSNEMKNVDGGFLKLIRLEWMTELAKDAYIAASGFVKGLNQGFSDTYSEPK